jgi:type I restriction enzyme S subunit
MEKYKIKDICQVLNGRAYKQAELLQEGKYKVLRVGNFFTSDRWYYSDMELDENKYCDNDDLLYAWSASFGPRLWEGDKTIYHYHIWKLIPDLRKVNKYYLYYWLMNNANQLTAGTHGSVMAHITKSSMENQDIVLPNLDIQFKVSDILHTIDEKIKTNEKINRNLEEQCFAVFHELFDEEIKEDLYVQFGEYATFKYGTMPKKNKIVDEGYPIFSGYQIVGRYPEKMFDEPQLIIVARGVGGTGDIKYTPANCYLTNLAIAIMVNDKEYEDYLYHYLMCQDMKVLNTGSAQPQITVSSLEKYKLYFPEKNKAKEFSSMIKPFIGEMRIIQQETEKLNLLRDTLLPKLMSGELDVSDLDL